jgi:hypothetical protein
MGFGPGNIPAFDSLQPSNCKDGEPVSTEEGRPKTASFASDMKDTGQTEPRSLEHGALRALRWFFTTPRGWWLICICFAAIVIWPARNHMFSDGLSYLDIGSEAAGGDLTALGNTYWSPAYPALIAGALSLLRPSAANEVPVLQLLNFFIFLLTFGAFSLFFRYWSMSIPGFEQSTSKDKGLFTLFAFASFLWFTASLIELTLTTPDMLLAAMVLLVAAMGIRVSSPGAGWKHFAALGALLGLGAYIKAALFPLDIALIALLFLSLARSSEIPRRRQFAFIAVTAAMCAAVAAPLIVCMSVQEGTLSMGDTGKLNYLWVVDKFKPGYTGWTGGTAPEYGTPLHPPRTLMENPKVLEFATPMAGTYPLWRSPGYWYAGARTVFDLHKQLWAFVASVHELLEIPMRSFGSDGFIGGAILLFVLGLGKNRKAHARWKSFWLPAWALVGCGMYSLVWAHWRYVGAFLLLLCLEAYRALIFRVDRRVAIRVCAVAVLVVMATLAITVEKSLVTTVRQFRHPVDEDYVAAARSLQRMGLQPGDNLAIVGKAGHPYYARYDRLRVVSEIEEPEKFWGLSQNDAKQVEDRLASIGVKALLAFNRPASFHQGGWAEAGTIEGRPFSVLLLQPANVPSH